MNVAIPKSLDKQLRQRARWCGVAKTEYARVALMQALREEDNEMIEEMQLWDEASLQDFQQFAKEYSL